MSTRLTLNVTSGIETSEAISLAGMSAPWVLVTPSLGWVCGEDLPGLINQ